MSDMFLSQILLWIRPQRDMGDRISPVHIQWMKDLRFDFEPSIPEGPLPSSNGKAEELPLTHPSWGRQWCSAMVQSSRPMREEPMVSFRYGRGRHAVWIYFPAKVMLLSRERAHLVWCRFEPACTQKSARKGALKCMDLHDSMCA